MSLDGVARPAGTDRGAAVQDPARDRRPEPACPHGRGADQRRWVRPGLVRQGGTRPAVYRSVSPAWGDANLRELAGHIESPLFIAHVRAAIGSPVQQTNCHPFRRGQWLFTHNGFIADFELLRRELMLAVDPALFADVHGSTDTEVVFHLALTFGLEEDPIGALERTVGLIEEAARQQGIAARCRLASACRTAPACGASATRPRVQPASLFASADVDAVRSLHPDNPRLQRLSPDDRLIVSEPCLRPARHLAGDPRGDGGDGTPRRRPGAPAVPPAGGFPGRASRVRTRLGPRGHALEELDVLTGDGRCVVLLRRRRGGGAEASAER